MSVAYAYASRSDIRRLRRAVEAVRQKNVSTEIQLGWRPTATQFGEAYLGAPLDPWQCGYMRDACETSRVAIAACRQSGKSTVSALFIAWCLVFFPGFQCLVASRSLRQAGHFVTIVRAAVLAMVPRDTMPQLNRLSMELPNGSAIMAIPCAQPDAGRGFSPQMVLLDEAAFAPEALFTAITPSLAATQGAMHMISSPNGRQGYFFEAFEGHSTDVYTTHRVPWMECPRITPEFIATERVALGEIYFQQEYEALFITPEGAFFGFSALQQLEEGEPEPLGDLDMRDMEEWLDKFDPLPEPTVDDLQVALDRADRVAALLHG